MNFKSFCIIATDLEMRNLNHNDRQKNFYMIGSMGLASSFALGIAKSNPNKK